MHALQNEQTHHTPDRQRRLPIMRFVDFAQPAAEKSPIDLLGQPRQRMTHGDDPIQRRMEQVLLTIVPRLCIRPEPP
jgi:hypothetical protein